MTPVFYDTIAFFPCRHLFSILFLPNEKASFNEIILSAKLTIHASLLLGIAESGCGHM